MHGGCIAIYGKNAIIKRNSGGKSRRRPDQLERYNSKYAIKTVYR